MSYLTSRRHWIQAAKMLVVLAPAMALYAFIATRTLLRVRKAQQTFWCDAGYVAFVIGAVLIARAFYIWFRPKNP